MAILVRASFQMRAFEDRFITLGVPYRVVGGPRFYERQEVRDALAYLKVTASPDNDLAFERIVNVPKRGIGDTSVKRMHEFARKPGRVALSRRRGIGAHRRTAGQDPHRAARLLSKSSRAGARRCTACRTPSSPRSSSMNRATPSMWQNDKSPEAQGRLENLKELVRSMGEFETHGGLPRAYRARHGHATAAHGEDKVNIMTLHSAKGLEFGTVFLPGWEEGLFPHQRSLDEKGRAGLEEERRLAYVGITRAKRRAYYFLRPEPPRP